MPFITKGGNRQTGSPSPTPGDILNTLLIIKDTVNATLLTEHTRLSDLSDTLTDVEDQIRAAVDTTIKNLKTEYEKRRRKTMPGIKRLQDSLKSLSKSESKCKASERYCKNADSKKAKRRIKDANKTLQECSSSDTDFGMSTFVADQITLLCQQLMQIPPKTKRHDTKEDQNNSDIGEKSDSDSQGSSRVNTPSHIYTEIDVSQGRNSTYLTPRRPTCNISSVTANHKMNINEKDTLSARLNSVVLFSSDSEDDYGFDDTRLNISTKGPRSAGNVKRKSRYHTKNGKPQSGSPDYEVLNRQKCSDMFRRCGYIDKVPSGSRLSPNLRSGSPVVYDEYEKPITKEIESLGAPIKEYIKRMSPSTELGFSGKHKVKDNHVQEHIPIDENSTSIHAGTMQDTSLASSRTVPKRYLPATPKLQKEINSNRNSPEISNTSKPTKEIVIDKIDGVLADTTDSVSISSACNTMELLNAANDLLSNTHISETEEFTENANRETIFNKEKISSPKRPAAYVDDYIDVDEIKFRESIRSARREIMNTLKSKYRHDMDIESVEADSNETKGRHSDSNYDLASNKISCEKEPKQLCFPGNNIVGSKIKDEDFHGDQMNAQTYIHSGLYRSKLIYTYETEKKQLELNSFNSDIKSPEKTSIVTSAIEKFENASKNDINYNFERRNKPAARNGYGGRYRSASEPRTALSQSKDKSKVEIHFNTRTNKALHSRYQYDNHCQGNNEIEDAKSVGDSLNFKKSCTENDLLNLVTSETSSSIRRQWSKRRSLSLTSRVDDVYKSNATVYEYWGSFFIPELKSRCFISAIVVLDDRSVVLLDQLNGCIHFFDKTFRLKDQYKLLEKPKGCVQVDSFAVAVAFPYSKCISMFSVKMGAILMDKETSVPCSEWIVDLAFSKPMLYVLCKAGEIHVLSDEGREIKRFRVDINGRLFIPPTGKRLFIIGEGRVSKYDNDGMFISSKADIDAHAMIFLENTIYVADRQKHKLLPLSGPVDKPNLIDIRIKYPTAISSSINGDIVLVSQFEDSMDQSLTRSVSVFKLRKK